MNVGGKLVPAPSRLPPSGWLGDPVAWPILFFPGKTALGRPLKHDGVLCYLSLDDYGGEDLELGLASALPDLGRIHGKMTWLEFETQLGDPPCFWEQVMEAVGGHEIWGGDETPVADWAMRNGFCPDQWLLVFLKPHYTTSYEGEHDFEVFADLILAEPLSPEEHSKRWQAFRLRVFDVQG